MTNEKTKTITVTITMKITGNITITETETETERPISASYGTVPLDISPEILAPQVL